MPRNSPLQTSCRGTVLGGPVRLVEDHDSAFPVVRIARAGLVLHTFDDVLVRLDPQLAELSEGRSGSHLEDSAVIFTRCPGDEPGHELTEKDRAGWPWAMLADEPEIGTGGGCGDCTPLAALGEPYAGELATSAQRGV